MSTETIELLSQAWKGSLSPRFAYIYVIDFETAQKEALELQLEESNQSYQRLYNVFKSTRAAEARCHSLQIQLDEANDLVRVTEAKCNSLQTQLDEANNRYRSECRRNEVLSNRISCLERGTMELCDGDGNRM